MAKIAAIQTKNGIRRIAINQSTDQTAEIEKLAYQFYVDRGYENGHDHEDWLRAEAIIKKRKS